MKIKNPGKTVVLASAVLVTAVNAEEWKNTVDFGLSLSKGNTDSSLVRAAFQTEKKTSHDTYYGALSYSYGEKDGEANEDEIIAKTKFKRNFGKKNFYGLSLDGRSDKFADIDYRFSFNFTYGYYWVDTADTVFSTESGIGLTAEDKGQGSETYLNGLLDQHFEHQLNDHAKVFQNLSISPRLGNVSDYRIEFDAGIKTQITETVAFKVSFEDRYESKPAAGKKHNDLKIIAGLSYKF